VASAVVEHPDHFDCGPKLILSESIHAPTHKPPWWLRRLLRFPLRRHWFPGAYTGAGAQVALIGNGVLSRPVAPA